MMAALSSCTSQRHPALRVLEFFRPIDIDVYFVEPYAINLFSIYALRHDLDYSGVESYIDWYFNNLNYPDKNGLTGSIYDYTIYRNGHQVANNTYDSVDAYAGTFLILLWEYYQRTGKRELLDANHFKILDIAYLILHLQESDGLARAIPEQSQKYLMDNCENYGGLGAFIKLCEALGWPDTDYYEQARLALKHGIETKLDVQQDQLYLWAVDDGAIHRSSWGTFYPDAFAQIFVILYGLIEPDSERARYIWNEFISRYDPEQGYQMDILQQVVVNMTREKMVGL
ncbi:MAG: hypothetical protein P9M14_15395 [Candidatus Alcyoniella australis]|nr:hypothetical protein [Candidatus Alcyoniella australis]